MWRRLVWWGWRCLVWCGLEGFGVVGVEVEVGCGGVKWGGGVVEVFGVVWRCLVWWGWRCGHLQLQATTGQEWRAPPDSGHPATPGHHTALVWWLWWLVVVPVLW